MTQESKLVLLLGVFLCPNINNNKLSLDTEKFVTLNTYLYSLFFKSFEITHWTKPGPIQKNALKELILDKQALFCLLTDKIDEEILSHAKNLQIIGR